MMGLYIYIIVVDRSRATYYYSIMCLSSDVKLTQKIEGLICEWFCCVCMRRWVGGEDLGTAEGWGN